MITLEGVLLFAFLLLPGAHARFAALRSTPMPWAESYRSPTQELAEILFYALVNGLISVLTLAAIAVAFFDAGPLIRQVLVDAVSPIDNATRLNIAIWLVVYLTYSISVAEVTGSTQLLTRVRGLAGTVFGFVDDFTHSTIWFWAIETSLKQPYRLADVAARVTLRDGRTYLGLMSNYPILGNELNKDFVLTSAEILSPTSGQFESVGGPLGRVLINSSNCEAIEIGPSGVPIPFEYGLVGDRPKHLVAWTLLLWLSSITLARLSDVRAVDNLDRLLLFVAALGMGAAFLGLLRLALIAANRWDVARSQAGWLLVALLLVAAALALAFGMNGLWAGLLIISEVLGLLVLASAPRVSDPALPSPPTA